MAARKSTQSSKPPSIARADSDAPSFYAAINHPQAVPAIDHPHSEDMSIGHDEDMTSSRPSTLVPVNDSVELDEAHDTHTDFSTSVPVPPVPAFPAAVSGSSTAVLSPATSGLRISGLAPDLANEPFVFETSNSTSSSFAQAKKASPAAPPPRSAANFPSPTPASAPAPASVITSLLASVANQNLPKASTFTYSFGNGSAVPADVSRPASQQSSPSSFSAPSPATPSAPASSLGTTTASTAPAIAPSSIGPIVPSRPSRGTKWTDQHKGWLVHSGRAYKLTNDDYKAIGARLNRNWGAVQQQWVKSLRHKTGMLRMGLNTSSNYSARMFPLTPLSDAAAVADAAAIAHERRLTRRAAMRHMSKADRTLLRQLSE